MVQVMTDTNKWVSVCDTGFDDVDAGFICRNIGYKDGKSQCCSSLGPKLVKYNPIGKLNLIFINNTRVSISNQPIPFPMDRDGHDFHTLFQYMFYTWVQNCTRIESFFNKVLNVKHG